MAIRQLKSILLMFALLGVSTLGCQPPSDADSDSSSTAATVTTPEEESTTVADSADADPEADAIAGTEPAEDSADETPDQVAADGESDEVAAETLEEEETVAVEPEPLGIGDPAPALAIAKWAKGDAVEGFEDGHVYVVEFWATWCGPCRVGMPHLAELQEEYKDAVTIIGVTRENESKVDSFFESEQDPETGKTWKEVMAYTVALDDSGQTNTSYMQAAGQNGIPCAFIVGKDGIVEWIGHPASMDSVLAAVVDDTYDRDAAIAEFAQRQALQSLMRDISPLLQQAKQSGDFSTVHKALDDAIDNGMSTEAVQTLRINIADFAQDHEMVNDLISKMYKDFWEDGQQLNEFAWKLVSRPEGSQDLELAMEIGMRANELTEGQDASTLDTVARIFYASGNLQEAIAWQTKAVESNSHPSLARTLAQYKSELEGDDAEESDTQESDAEAAAEDSEAEEADSETDEDAGSEEDAS